MLTTLTWWGIGLTLIVTILAILVTMMVWKTTTYKGGISYKTIGIIGGITSTTVFIGFILYINLILGLRIAIPSIFSTIPACCCVLYIYFMVNKDPKKTWKPKTISKAVLPVIIMVLCQVATIFMVLHGCVSSTVIWNIHNNNQNMITLEHATKNTLTRSALIEQNIQHTEANGETFLGAGSFTLKSESDLKIYHVWQERNQNGTLHVNVAQDGEGKDDKNRDKAVIRDDVTQGTEPYVERIPVYETDPLMVTENNGHVCVKNQDTGCRVNAKHAYDKIIIHVPAGSVVPNVDPNLPVEK